MTLLPLNLRHAVPVARSNVLSTTASSHHEGLSHLVYRGERHLTVTTTRHVPGQDPMACARHSESYTLDEARALLEMLAPQVAALEADLAPRVSQ